MRAGALDYERERQDPDQTGRLALVHTSLTTATTMAHERTVPVDDGLVDLLPNGYLQRGSNVVVQGVGATSFALALVAEAVRGGSFLAIVAPRSFGLGACIDFDIPLRRVVQFTPSEPAMWAQVIAAVIEGFDLVLLADSHRAGAGQTRQLVARNRERGSVLIRVGGRPWPDAADLRFDVGDPEWSGLGDGHGHLQSRRVAVQVDGRRHHGAPRSHQILLPASSGGVAPYRAPAPVASSVPVPGERFAGSDIDAMFDAVEHRAGVECRDGDTGLGAIA